MRIERNDSEQRVDRYLKKYLANASLSQIYKIIRKDLKVNSKRVKENHILHEGDILDLYIGEDELNKLVKEEKAFHGAKKQFKIVYEDENIIAVNKPAGLLVHGDRQEKKNTLVNQVTDYLIAKGDYIPRLEKTFSPASANRIDRNTSGLVIFGKNSMALKALNRIISNKEAVKKEYFAIVDGIVAQEILLKDSFVKDEGRNQVFLDQEEGKEMETRVIPLCHGKNATLLRIVLLTGRTHQIRVQLAKAGHPIIGDPKYGVDKRGNANRKSSSANKEARNKGQMLHSYSLEFLSCPEELKYLEEKRIEALPPEYFINEVKNLFGQEGLSWIKIVKKN
ncbi:MAG: RluA family pseudouridine synthase [Clostridia bacterium]|nr:RluA family pseudouridine synthase [Clostridia bacterium]